MIGKQESQVATGMVLLWFYPVFVSALPSFSLGRNTYLKSPLSNSGFGENRNRMEVAPGVFIDTSDKFIQRIIPSGTIYMPYGVLRGAPTFRRRIQDSGRHFILFPDNEFPRGSGHYIVLRRYITYPIRSQAGEPLYQAYKLVLSDSARSMVVNWPNEGEGARGQKGTVESPDDDRNHGRGKSKDPMLRASIVDAGEVVNRRRRNEQKYAHQFSRGEATFPKGSHRSLDPFDGNFNGFSVEAVE